MKHLLILVTFLSFSGISFAVDYDSVFHVISDRSNPFDDRYEAIIRHFDYFSVEQRTELIQEMTAMIPESKKKADKTQTIHLYGNISLVYINDFRDFETGKFYVDSAMVYENHASDLGKAKLYIVAGSYYASQSDSKTMMEYLYKSISLYEKVGGYYDERVISLFNIAANYLNERDTTSTRQIIAKMELLAKQANTFKSNLFTCSLIAKYYFMMYVIDPQQAHYRDSALFHCSKIIRQYESLKSRPSLLAASIAAVYMSFAEMGLRTQNPDPDLIRYVEKALEIAPKSEQIIKTYYFLVAYHHLKQNNLDMALESFHEALRIQEQYEEDLLDKRTTLAYISYVHQLKSEWKEALEYEMLFSEVQSKIYERDRSQIYKDLETRYEVAKKEESIRHLTEQNRFRERINRLYLGMLILVGLVCVLVILWFRGKRKADAAALQISRFQQQEAELRANIETARFEEKESQYNALASEMQMRQIRSYLEGLEAERARLAGELHDNVSNSLLGVVIKMRDPDVSTDEISGLLNGIQEHVRNISHELMPPVFQYAALSEIIADYVHMQNGMSGARFEYHITPEDGWDDLPHETALELHRIIQESCGNALKHSGASLISISLHRDANRVRLTVSDNGCGMSTVERKQGVGLQLIHDRAAKMNGTVEIVSAPEKGTKIIVNC